MTDSAALDDVELMLRLKEGDDAALDRLMDRWREPLFHYLVRMTGQAEDAADLAQETFVRVYQKRSRYRAKGSFSTWLFTIATRLARNRARWKRRHPEHPLEAERGGDESGRPDPLQTLAAPGKSPSEEAVRRERAEEVRLAVGRLPESLRQCLVLSVYQEMSHVSIAALVGGTAKAVERRVAKARGLLKLWLDP